MSSDPTTNANPPLPAKERRFDRRSWAMLALAGFVLLYGVGLAFYAAQRPTDGWSFQYDLTQPNPSYRFVQYYGALPTALQPGDALVAINGQPIEQLFAALFALQWSRPAGWQAGNTLDYTIERDGRQLTVAVPLTRLPSSAIGRFMMQGLSSILLLGMNLVMLTIGLAVFLQRPRYLPAQLLLLFCWSLTGSQLVLAPPSVQVVLDPIVFFFLYIPIFLPIWQLTIFPVLVHLLLVFPVVKRPLQRHPRLLLPALYTPGVLGTWLALLLNLGQPGAVESAWGVVQAFHLLTALALVMVSVAHTFRTVHDATVRAQMRWVTVGIVFGFMGSALGWLFFTLVGVDESLYALLIYPLLLLPLSLAIAILRYRLFDIDVIIRRTLIYGVVSALLTAIYISSVVALQTLFRLLTGQSSGIAIALSTLGIAALALPLRNRIQTAIDRRFYRQKYDAQQTLARFVAGLQNQTDLAGLAAGVRDVVQETLQPTGVEVWLVADPTDSTAGAEPTVPAGLIRLTPADPLVTRLQHNRGVVEVKRLTLRSSALQAMKAVGVVLVAPLINQNEVIGVITLGARRSEQGYTTDDRQLLTNLATQAAPAFRVAKLVRQQRQEAHQRAQIEQELQVARSIQQTLLPQAPPALPGWTIETHYQPARAVGGDFYDFIPLPDGRLSLIIGDVTDKGVPAALVMAMTRTLLREMTKVHDAPGAILAAVNDRLVGDIPEKMFVTCFYAILTPMTGRLIYANAGHNLPYWRTQDAVKELHAGGMPLGLLPGMRYEEKAMVIDRQDTVLFYTDGLVEAHDPQRNMLGTARVKETIATHVPNADHDRSADIVAHLLRHQAVFTGPDWEQEDDISLIILQRGNECAIKEGA
ncbi:MAG: GAF domain-containing protein [Caldilinea sp. CFX5]|nr:GAF domain-containing protein [Caldilinea sp. CFX5]